MKFFKFFKRKKVKGQNLPSIKHAYTVSHCDRSLYEVKHYKTPMG